MPKICAKSFVSPKFCAKPLPPWNGMRTWEFGEVIGQEGGASTKEEEAPACPHAWKGLTKPGHEGTLTADCSYPGREK